MSIAEKYRPHYTYADYCIWEGRWELIEGMPYAISPAPNSRHQLIATELGAKFSQSLKACKKCKVFQPIDWKITEDTVVQPDLSVVCKPFNTIAYLDFPPSLVVEILSPSTAQKDRREKYELYESQQVKYYLIIDPAFKKVEIFELIDNHYQAVAVNPSTFDFLIDDCAASIAFGDLFED
jgi:Uma2 family endonuclease